MLHIVHHLLSTGQLTTGSERQGVGSILHPRMGQGPGLIENRHPLRLHPLQVGLVIEQLIGRHLELQDTHERTMVRSHLLGHRTGQSGRDQPLAGRTIDSDIVDTDIGFVGRKSGGKIPALLTVGSIGQIKLGTHLLQEGRGRLIVPVACQDEGLARPLGLALDDGQRSHPILFGQREMGAGKHIPFKFGHQQHTRLLPSGQGDPTDRQGLLLRQDTHPIASSLKRNRLGIGGMQARLIGPLLQQVASIDPFRAAIDLLQGHHIEGIPVQQLTDTFRFQHFVQSLTVTDVITHHTHLIMHLLRRLSLQRYGCTEQQQQTEQVCQQTMAIHG